MAKKTKTDDIDEEKNEMQDEEQEAQEENEAEAEKKKKTARKKAKEAETESAEKEPEMQEGYVEKKAKATKAPARKREKKDRVSPIIKEISLVLETGKCEFGSRKAYSDSMLGKAKALVLASSMDKEIKTDLVRYAKLSKIPLIEYDGNSLELGSVCGRAYPVSVIIIYDTGKSSILDHAAKL